MPHAQTDDLTERPVMEFVSSEVQIVSSVVIVLGAALIALICDLLKGENDRMRARIIDLLARLQSLERWRSAHRPRAPRIDPRLPVLFGKPRYRSRRGSKHSVKLS
jgi:hypothetical protein